METIAYNTKDIQFMIDNTLSLRRCTVEDLFDEYDPTYIEVPKSNQDKVQYILDNYPVYYKFTHSQLLAMKYGLIEFDKNRLNSEIKKHSLVKIKLKNLAKEVHTSEGNILLAYWDSPCFNPKYIKPSNYFEICDV